jgi:hypothetical protein
MDLLMMQLAILTEIAFLSFLSQPVSLKALL